jgi:hypothetical protein
MAKREHIDTGSDTSYARRDAAHESEKGQGDRGDRRA